MPDMQEKDRIVLRNIVEKRVDEELPYVFRNLVITGYEEELFRQVQTVLTDDFVRWFDSDHFLVFLEELFLSYVDRERI
jgi:hypothetical protein